MSTNQEISTRYRPTIALAMGDPAGVSPELAARLLCLEELLVLLCQLRIVFFFLIIIIIITITIFFSA